MWNWENDKQNKVSCKESTYEHYNSLRKSIVTDHPEEGKSCHMFQIIVGNYQTVLSYPDKDVIGNLTWFQTGSKVGDDNYLTDCWCWLFDIQGYHPDMFIQPIITKLTSILVKMTGYSCYQHQTNEKF